MRLKSRSNSPPNGFIYKQKETGWENRVAVPSSQWDFNLLVQSVREHRLANPRFNLTTDLTAIAEEVDQANAFRVAQMEGADSYIVGDSPPPKTVPPQQQNLINAAAAKAKLIWAGIKTLDDWIDSGEPPVDKTLAERRASVCAECPKNGKGDFEAWFTKPASEKIRKQLAKAHAMNLSTIYDDKIQVCEACLCPLKLKVFTPMKFIAPRLKSDTIEALRGGKDCWIISEMAK